MQQSDHIIWDVDPTAFTIGTINLPFPIAIWGLVAAMIIFFWGLSKLMPDDKKRSGKEEEELPEGWKILGLAVGSFILGQLIFLVLPSATFQQIGPIQPRWYGILFALSFVAGYMVERRLYLKAGRTEEELERLLTYVLIATVVGARLGHVIFYDLLYYLRHPGQIIAIWQGGLASHGAAIGILIAMYLYVRKYPKMTYLWLADRVVVAVALAGAFIRTGNFMNSEIVGQPSDLPWAIIFSRIDMIPRHPTMLYEALLCLVVFAVLWIIIRRYKSHPPEGSIFGTFLILLFGGRFFLEFTKIPQAEFAAEWAFNMGQWLSVPLVAAGVWLLWKKVDWGKKERRRKGEEENGD